MEEITPISMDRLREGQWACVEQVLLTGTMEQRLQELGLISGTEIQCVQKSPAGDPVAYLIRGAVIALRNQDAAGVLVSRV